MSHSYLNQVLPPGFAAVYEERVILLPAGQSIVPDTTITQSLAALPASKSSASTAVLDNPRVHGLVTMEWEEVSDDYIEVVTTDREQRVVTVIEVLSPSNKATGEDHEKYKSKQAKILASDTNLLEIDLLRQGRYTVAIPETLMQKFGRWYGVVSLHRAFRHQEYEYWLCRMSEPLPPVTVPLTPGVPEIVCDIQKMYQRLYNDGRFAQRIDYALLPSVPLTEEEKAWVDALLREKGLRP